MIKIKNTTGKQNTTKHIFPLRAGVQNDIPLRGWSFLDHFMPKFFGGFPLTLIANVFRLTLSERKLNIATLYPVPPMQVD